MKQVRRWGESGKYISHQWDVDGVSGDSYHKNRTETKQ